MEAFSYYSPTEIVFGKGAEKRAAELIKKYGGNRVIVVYGGSSVVKSGLLHSVCANLKSEGIFYCEKGGITANPLVEDVRDGVKIAIDFKADFVLGVGGGSVLDAAKAIAHGTANPDTDVWEFWAGGKKVQKSLPVGAILTISAAGSETSSSSVLTNNSLKQKRGINTDFNRPKFALMNPELSYSVPRHQLACGVVDIFMHTFDRFFSSTSAANTLTDALAVALLKTVIKYGRHLLDNPSDYEAVSEIMWCSSVSHTGLTGLGRTPDFSVHQLGHELSGAFNVPHAMSLSAVLPFWADYVMKKDLQRFAFFGRSVFDVDSKLDDLAAAKEAVKRTTEFFKSVEMPLNFVQLGIGKLSQTQIEKLADSCVFFGKRKVGVFYPLDKQDIINIYSEANKD